MSWNEISNEDKREFVRSMRQATPVTLDTIMRAKTKPANTSDVRWRIELRRRAKAEYFDACGECR